MRAFFLLLLVPLAMWVTQSLTLVAAGLPIRVRIDPVKTPPHLRRNLRVSLHATFVAVLALYPLVRGRSPLAYYLSYFPLGSRPGEFVWGVAAAILYLAALYIAWLAAGVIRFGRERDRMSLTLRLVRALLSAVLLALVEEMVFRSMLLADLLLSFDGHPWAAIAIGTAIFSTAHYVRRVTRHWVIFGQIAVGLLFSVAFVTTQALWLPVGLHAGGILFVRGLRPVTRSDGPHWLVGESAFPFAGVPGIVAAVLLAFNVFRTYRP